ESLAMDSKWSGWLGEVFVKSLLRIAAAIFFLLAPTLLAAQQIGKAFPISSEANQAINEINSASDPAQKLALIDKFASGAQGDTAILADEQYVNFYLGQKQYDKAFEYGDKLFALDPENFQNGVNRVRAAAEKGDTEKLLAYGEKAQTILTTYKASPAPSGVNTEQWEQQKSRALE